MSGATARAEQSSENVQIDPLVIRVLTQLGAAIQRHRIYPPLSPLCQEAVEVCAETLRTLAIQEAKRVKTAAESAGARTSETDEPHADASDQVAPGDGPPHAFIHTLIHSADP